MKLQMNRFILVSALASGLAFSLNAAQAATDISSQPIHAKAHAVGQVSHQQPFKPAASTKPKAANQPGEAQQSQQVQQHHAESVKAAVKAEHQQQNRGSGQQQLAAHNAQKVSINTATVAQLQKLHGINAEQAHAIVAHREQYGAFKRLDDLKNVKGLSPSVIRKNEALLSI